LPAKNHPQSLTLEDCYDHISTQVFRLRPQNYHNKYPKWPGLVGLELEMLPVMTASIDKDKPQLVPLPNGVGSLSDALLKIVKTQKWQPESYSLESNGDSKELLLRVMMDHEDQLSFEPGGQLEFSSSPYPCLEEALTRLTDVKSILSEHLQSSGITLLQTGINPWHTTAEIGLQMQKSRYQAMNKYFSRISEYGPRMMRQTCTVQVNLDFGADETTLAKRYLLGNLLAPVTTAIFANSPFVDGKDTGMQSFRGRVWRGIDITRTGIPPLEKIAKALNKKECVDSYLEFLLNAPVVFIEALAYRVPDKPLKFRDWLRAPVDGVSPTLEDFKTHLSLHFPELRPRGFMELRSVDCQGEAWTSVPATFYTSLLYVDSNLDRVLDGLAHLLGNIDQFLEKSSFGLKDPELARIGVMVMEAALSGIGKLPSCFQGEGTEKRLQIFHENFTARGRSPADDLRDEVKRGGGKITGRSLVNLDKSWQQLIS
jgi:glutamate--cysteine ligase